MYRLQLPQWASVPSTPHGPGLGTALLRALRALRRRRLP
jgi:hypothetical protein